MTGKTSRGIKGLILCGRRREKADLFQIVEMLDCTEIFGSHILRSLLKQAKDAKWEDGRNTRTKAVPERNPKLNPEFHVPTDEPHKRRWHVFQILGELPIYSVCGQTKGQKGIWPADQKGTGRIGLI